MNGPKIVVISFHLPIPPIRGGAVETLVFETSRLYAKCQVEVYSRDVGCPQPAAQKENNANFIVLTLPKWGEAVTKFLNRFAAKGPVGLYDIFLLKRMFGRIAYSPDIFHIHNSYYCIPSIKRRFPKAKIVLHMHNDFLSLSGSLRRSCAEALSLIDEIVVISEFLKKQILSKHCIDSEKIRVIYNGVAINRFKKIPSVNEEMNALRSRYHISLNDKVLLFVGRICKDKGVAVLIEAFASLCKKRTNLKLLIVGSSWFLDAKPTEYLQACRRLSEKVKDKIIFTGFIPHDELNLYYNLAHLCVVPSIWEEPLGLVNLEAMASECALIATKVGGIPEIVNDKKTGLLAMPNDVSDLSEKIEQVLSDNAFRERMGRDASNYVRKNLNWVMVAQKYEDVYHDLMKI